MLVQAVYLAIVNTDFRSFFFSLLSPFIAFHLPRKLIFYGHLYFGPGVYLAIVNTDFRSFFFLSSFFLLSPSITFKPLRDIPMKLILNGP